MLSKGKCIKHTHGAERRGLLSPGDLVAMAYMNSATVVTCTKTYTRSNLLKIPLQELER